jgi:hypothetical protein
VIAKKKYNPNEVAAGWAYSSAYLEVVHYAERLIRQPKPWQKLIDPACAPGASRSRRG